MTKTYADVQAQIARLQAEADALRAKEVAEVVGRIREAMIHYGLTIADLGFTAKRGRRGSSAAKKVRSASAPKYGDGQGNVWGGRGPRPAWLREALAQGHELEEFALQGRANPEAPRKAGKPRKASAPAPRGRQGGKSVTRGAKAAKRPRKSKPAISQAAQPESSAGATPLATE